MTHYLSRSRRDQRQLESEVLIDHTPVPDQQSQSYILHLIQFPVLWRTKYHHVSSHTSSLCSLISLCSVSAKQKKSEHEPFLSVDILRMIYFSYVQSVMSYGIILGGNSHPSNSIFKIQKIIIRIITNTGSRDSCRQLFKQLQIHFLLTCFC